MPIPVVTVEEMRSWERHSWEAGAREDDVIRQVGHCVAETVREGTLPGSRILVLAGRGNNGADALAAVPPLAPDFRIETLRILSPASQRDELARALEARPDLILDGLFGIGPGNPSQIRSTSDRSASRMESEASPGPTSSAVAPSSSRWAGE